MDCLQFILHKIMENPAPFDLNEAIRCWQQSFGRSPAFKADNLEELASHVRASVQKLMVDGLSEEEAFKVATQRIGERGPLEREFAKVNPLATRSLPLLSFWIVAGIYLFQVVSSLVFGLLNLRQLIEQRGLRRLIAEGADPGRVINHVSWFYYLPRSIAPMLSLAVVMLFVLGVRWAAGSWKGFGVFLSSFKRPVRTALGLLLLGLVMALLPDVLASFLPPEKTAMPLDLIARNRLSINDIYGLFLLGYFETKSAVPLVGYLAGQGAIIVGLVLSMVLLAGRQRFGIWR
jgi:hypothetical protein